MRDKLYKAKRVDNGEWIDGFYLYQRESTTDKKNHFIVTNNGFGFSWNIVAPETVREYVNLMDCDFNKIFNGDLLKDENGTIWLMAYATGWWSYQIVSQNTKVQQYCTICPITRTNVGDYLPSMKTIGNKWNNPELLKELRK